MGLSPHPSENSTLRSAFSRLVGMSDLDTIARKFHPIIHIHGGTGEARGKNEKLIIVLRN